MKTVGYCLFICGAICAVVSFFLPTTVESYSTYSIAGGGTLNLGLLQDQMMVLHVGLTGFLGGAVLIGCGEVAERLSTLSGNSETATDAAPATTPNEALEATTIDGSIADGIAIKVVFGLILLVLFVLLFIYLANRPTTVDGGASVNSVTANLDAEADKLANEADALARSSRP